MSYIVVKRPDNKFKVYRAEDHPQAIAGGFRTREDAINYGIASGRTEEVAQ